MAEKTKKEAEEMITIRVPVRGKEPDLFVGLNFKNYILKRGEYVTIPKSVYEVIMNSEHAEEIAEAYAKEKEAAYLRKAANPIQASQE